MLVHLRRSVVLSVLFVLVCGLAFPLAGTGVSQLFMKHQADGSLTSNGSTLIGQDWAPSNGPPMWFQGRPDGTVVTCAPYPSCSKHPDEVFVSGTAQLGPRSKALEEQTAALAKQLRAEGIIPTSDLVTTSGSLVDPDISPADAYAQVGAIARDRHLDPAAVRRLVASQVHGPELGFLGARYVDVLTLNQALAKLG
ncbi:MAG TPA: potassium-transporting ATPase subunit C [Acidimicrobiales bacterium]|nr:potassium-transporting ATPase subunit C [Acidimicrobiales bacterium]